MIIKNKVSVFHTQKEIPKKKIVLARTLNLRHFIVVIKKIMVFLTDSRYIILRLWLW